MLPSITTLRDAERETLQVISEMKEFTAFNELFRSAKDTGKNILKDRGGVNFNAGFEMNIKFRSDKLPVVHRRVDIGALVVPTEDQKSIKHASYRVIICESNLTTSPIVRKLHFDFEPIGSRDNAQAKPSVHVQICGELDKHLRSIGYHDDQLVPWFPHFEQPRIPGLPTSLALLIHWLLLEFQTDINAQKILQHSRWQQHVAQTERLILKPFFEGATNFLTSAANTKKVFVEKYLYNS